ncbi:hypothetical protein KVT40_001442 [Elsinoe batatas]|uniref:Cytochrome P450 monooxygenase n=1 Tax=Elsinoe batatas TaxID=2601811 RepID=A0A8K0L816_9PEZI|nr:hypothetical protein KVT40_001442 [Elsinoe batatas]
MIADTVIDSVRQHWAISLLAAVTLWLTRNYFRHGLNKYPGPLACHLTDWWRFYRVWKRDPHWWHVRLHRKHGDIVRLGPNCLSFAHPRAAKTIYALGKGFTKSEFYPVQMATAKGKKLPTLFSTLSEEFHADLKRSVNHAFSMSSQMQYEPFFDSTNDVFVRQTRKLFANTGTTCDFYKWMQFYTFDVIGDMVYSKRHGFLEGNVDVDNIVRDNAKLFDYAALIGQIPILDKLWNKNPVYLLLAKYGLVKATFPVAKFAQARLHERHPEGTNFSTDKFLWQQEKTNAPPDLLSKFVLAKTERPDFFTDQLVVTMCVSMGFAGSEPTAVSLSMTFASLLRDPRVLNKLVQELDNKARDGHFKDNINGHVTWQEAQQLPYLRACIMESLRLHPAPGLPFERVTPSEGVEIDGHFIKGGTIVGCSAWVIHRREDIFGEDLETYYPERWLPDPSKNAEDEAARIRHMELNIMSFGKGPRVCLGRHIGEMEMYKLIPTILRNFKLTLTPESYNSKYWNGWFVRPTNLKVNIENRELAKPIEA